MSTLAADEATQGETKTPQPSAPSTPSAQPKAPYNAPGFWKGPFITHTRHNGDGVAVSNEVYFEMDVRGLPSWLDVRMDDPSEQAMEEGVKKSSCCVAVVTGPCVNPDFKDKPEDNAYFKRKYCLQELRWAREANKPIVCLVRAEDRDNIDLFFEDAPDDLKYLRGHVILYDRNDPEYQKIGIRKLLVATGLRPEGFGSVPIVQNDTPPKSDGGSHWTMVCDHADIKGAALVSTVARSMRQRGYVVYQDEKEEEEDDDSMVQRSDALLVILTDNVFTDSICDKIRAARSRKIPVVCAVSAEDKTRIYALSQNAPDDLKNLANDAIFHLETEDEDYLECGVTKILRASGHVTREDVEDENVVVDIRLDPFRPHVLKRVAVLGKDFHGRDWLAEAVQKELENGGEDGGESKSSSSSSSTTSTTNTFLVVYGDSGTGKSAFFSRLLDKKFCRTKGGSWHYVSSRLLADHICRVQDDDTLSPIQWARSIAGQIFLALPERHRHGIALKVGGYADREAFTCWLEKEESVRKVLTSWVIPVLKSLDSAGAFFKLILDDVIY